MEKVHAIERELYGEIVQIKKERLVQVTRCTATETVQKRHCGWQSHAGPGRYAKFHDPITIEPADCRQAAKTHQDPREGSPIRDECPEGSVS
jgi:hypothetical protein